MKRGGLWVLLHKNNVLMCKYIRVHKYVSKRFSHPDNATLTY